jgi:hypothetical protein
MVRVRSFEQMYSPVCRIAAKQHKGSQYTCDNGSDEHADLNVVAGRSAVSERKFTNQ